jgi:NitT/TauT family transport system substrate-binding protein
LAVLLILSGVGDSTGRAAVPAREKVRIVYAGFSGGHAPGWAAHEGSFFLKQGLDVDLAPIVGDAEALRSLLAGKAAFAQVSGLSVLESSLQGSDVVILAGMLNVMTYQFIVAREIARPEHLKGKKVAISWARSSSDFAMRYALDKYGLVPEQDVAVVEIGNQPERFAALTSGKIQGLMLELPLTLKAKKMGFRVLADLQMLGLEYQATALATTRATIKARPDLVRKVLMAYVEGIHYYKTRRNDALSMLRKYLKTADRESLTKTYEWIGLTLLPRKPYPTLRGIQIMLRELSAKNPKAEEMRAEEFVNTTFLQELDSSGFIDGLYTPQVSAASMQKRATRIPRDAGKKTAVTIQSPPPEAKTQMLTNGPVGGKEYIIQPGDTLGQLAEQFYGSTDYWGKIYEANTQTIRNPNYVFVGQKISLPAEDTAPSRSSHTSARPR